MYINRKLRPIETIPEMEERGKRRVMEWANSSMIYMIYCKNFVNITMDPHPAQS
jgi:hypothetical protein